MAFSMSPKLDSLTGSELDCAGVQAEHSSYAGRLAGYHFTLGACALSSCRKGICARFLAFVPFATHVVEPTRPCLHRGW